MRSADLTLPDSPARLELEDVSAGYNGVPALQHVTMQVPHGARLAIVGPNGSGKSTLFKALVGLLPLSSGSVRIHGDSLNVHRDCVAYVPQREEVDWRFPVTALDVVLMGRYGRRGWLRRLTADDRAVARGSLQRMGMERFEARPIADLSGGEQQRIFLARALAQEPHILLMDEPFNGVDVGTRETILALLDELSARKVTALVSTHDLNLAATRFDQVALLNRDLVAYGSPAEVFTPVNLAEVFGGQALFLEGGVVVDQCCPGEAVCLVHDAHQQENDPSGPSPRPAGGPPRP